MRKLNLTLEEFLKPFGSEKERTVASIEKMYPEMDYYIIPPYKYGSSTSIGSFIYYLKNGIAYSMFAEKMENGEPLIEFKHTWKLDALNVDSVMELKDFFEKRIKIINESQFPKNNYHKSAVETLVDLEIRMLNESGIQQTILPFYNKEKTELAYSLIHFLDGIFLVPCIKKDNHSMIFAELKTNEMIFLDEKRKKEIIDFYQETVDVLDFMIKTQRLRTLTQKETH